MAIPFGQVSNSYELEICPKGIVKHLRVTHLIIKTKHMRAGQEYHTLDSLGLHATVFLFNCVSPKTISFISGFVIKNDIR